MNVFIMTCLAVTCTFTLNKQKTKKCTKVNIYSKQKVVSVKTGMAR